MLLCNFCLMLQSQLLNNVRLSGVSLLLPRLRVGLPEKHDYLNFKYNHLFMTNCFLLQGSK